MAVDVGASAAMSTGGGAVWAALGVVSQMTIAGYSSPRSGIVKLINYIDIIYCFYILLFLLFHNKSQILILLP